MTYFWGILGLGFLVFFHELGHYILARICGVKVEAFSVGMGPVLLHKTINDTDYRISLIPLGGYCAMKGESDFINALENNSDYIEADKDSFYGIHPLKRLLIAFAGPAANYFFGFLAFFIIALMGYTYYSAGTVVSMADEVYPDMRSAAHEAGMQTGDKILALNDHVVSDFSEISVYIATHGDKDITVRLERNNQILEYMVHSDLDLNNGSGKIGIVSNPDSVIMRTYPQHNFFSAVKEGFVKSNDVIVQTIQGVRTLFKGVKVSNSVSGPARITSIVGKTVKSGFSEGIRSGIIYTLEILSIISISLFLTNLLPVPILDGGLIIFAASEWVLRKKLSPRFLKNIQIAGIIVVAFLMVLSVGSDILYFSNRG